MSSKKQLLAQYDLHHVLFNNVIANISDAESNKCVADPMNSVKWLAGHLLWAQGNLANIGGAKVEVKWRDHFHTKQGATPADLAAPPSELPTLEEIKTKWNEDGPAIRTGLENLPDVALEQGWTKEETMISLMRKAGWNGRSSEWNKVPDLKVVRYQGRKAELSYKKWREWRDWVEETGRDEIDL